VWVVPLWVVVDLHAGWAGVKAMEGKAEGQQSMLVTTTPGKGAGLGLGGAYGW
jgi:hypothetical protein